MLSQLLQQPNVGRVYCLIRGSEPLSRLQQSLQDRHLSVPNSENLYVLTSDLSRPSLGLDDTTYNDLLAQTTHIIHCAWPVNFQLALSSFEASLKGLQNLLQLSLDVSSSRPAHFIFCSSISAALGTPSPARIPELPISDLEQVSETGYAQSKLVSEHIVQAAVENAGVNATILRIGQVVGDTKTGVWNDSEAFPLIIRSAVSMGILPELSSTCEWLPVDTLAKTIIQIGGISLDHGPRTNGFRTGRKESLKVNGSTTTSNSQLVYNLVSPHSFSWTSDLLPALSSAGLSFRPKTLATWLHQLHKLSSTQSNSSGNDANRQKAEPAPTAAADPNQNPAIKLVGFFEESFQDNSEAGDSGIRFETGEAENMAPALHDAPLVIESGLLKKMVDAWMEKWKGQEVKRARSSDSVDTDSKRAKMQNGH